MPSFLDLCNWKQGIFLGPITKKNEFVTIKKEKPKQTFAMTTGSVLCKQSAGYVYQETAICTLHLPTKPGFPSDLRKNI